MYSCKSRLSAAFIIAASLCLVAVGRTAKADFVGALVEVKLEAVIDGQLEQGVLRVALPFEKPGSAPADRIQWRLKQPSSIRGQRGHMLGSIDNLEVELDGDPKVSLSFAVGAGPAGSTFSISSAVVSFSPILNPLSFATAAVTVTDDSGDGALATGLFPGGTFYQARYNSPAVAWANLVVGPVVVPVDDSLTARGRRPFPSGREVIPASVYSIQSEFFFHLSANDSASGTSTFDVLIPLPSAAWGISALLSCLGLARVRRHA